MNFQAIKESIETESKRFYSLKTNAAKTKSRAKIVALKVQAAELLDKHVNSISGTITKGKVILVDNRDGDLWIETEEFGRVYASITCSVDSKSWYATTCCVEFERGMEVEFILEASVNFDKSCINLVAKAIKGGRFNAERYAELCQKDNLAFFKYPDGHMSGLFSTK